MKRALLALLAAFGAAPALAQETAPERDLCTDRPGLGTPACTVAPGRIIVETELADWTRDDSGGVQTDRWLFVDTLVRIGIADAAELQFGWTPFGHQRERSVAGIDRAGRVGDVTLGAKINLASPDGGGFSAAVLPQLTLPVGPPPIGAGDWGFSLIVPLSYALSDTLQLQASPELDAAVDADGDGRHAAYGTTVGLGLSLSDAVSAAVEVQVICDRDPAGGATQAFAGLSAAWQPGDDLQFDAGANLGLNDASDDLELYVGVSRRF